MSLILSICVILWLILSLSACDQPLSSELKLRGLVAHQHKMEVILQDVQEDCDSTRGVTLKYRTDSLITALNRQDGEFLAALEHPAEPPAESHHAAEPHAAHKHEHARLSPHTAHHAHQKPGHHHNSTQPK